MLSLPYENKEQITPERYYFLKRVIINISGL